MKEMKCLECEEKFKAESPQDMMQAMMPHYMNDHREMMEDQNEESKGNWMNRFNEAWDNAKELE